jgi:uncharacterized membrane protein YheB (UPF0754 family)
MSDLALLIALPASGALAGWLAGRLGVLALFHPRRPRFGLHGLLPARQPRIASAIGQVVAARIDKEKLFSGLDSLDLSPQIAELLDRAIAKKLVELQQIPLIGSFITKERVAGLRDGLLAEFVASQPKLIATLKAQLVERVDLGRLTEQHLAALDLVELEQLLNRQAGPQLRAIAWWAAGAGALLGLAQAGLAIALR